MKKIFYFLLIIFTAAVAANDDLFDELDKNQSNHLEYDELLIFYNRNFDRISNTIPEIQSRKSGSYTLSLYFYIITKKIEIEKFNRDDINFFSYDLCLKVSHCKRQSTFQVTREEFSYFYNQLKD